MTGLKNGEAGKKRITINEENADFWRRVVRMSPLFKKFLPYLPFLKPTNGLKDYSWTEKMKAPSFQKWAIAIGTALILTLLLSPALRLPPKAYRIGDIATREIKSTQDLLVEDERATQEKRLEAEKAVLSVYDYDPGVLKNAESRTRSAFQALTASVHKDGKGEDQSTRRKSSANSIEDCSRA